MTAIFDGPVTPVGADDPLRVGLIRGTADDTISDFLGILPGHFLYGFPLTGRVIAKRIGILEGDGKAVLTGRELDQLSLKRI